MSAVNATFADAIRRVVRAEIANAAPRVERWRVVRKKPLTLEAFGSELRLVDGEDDFDVGRDVRHHAKVGDTVTVLADIHGDYTVVGLASGFSSHAKKPKKLSSTKPPTEEEEEATEPGGVDEAEEGEEAEAGPLALAAIAAGGIGVIVHGENSEEARGDKFPFYVWIGNAAPENAHEHDFWANPG